MATNRAREALLTHMLGERARDVDATMTPVSEHPRWPAPNYVVEGRDAVRALYERSLPPMRDGWMDECLRALDDPQATQWGENHCVIEYSDAYPMHRGWVMVVHFDGDRIRSENVYPPPDHGLPASLGADFDALAGVTRLS